MFLFVRRLWLSLLVLAVLAMALGCSDDDGSHSLGPDWMRTGKLAGLGVYVGMPDKILNAKLDELKDAHVDVIIGDSKLSNYLSDKEFDEQIDLINRVSAKAHSRGMRVVYYLTSLEIQTVDGKNKASTMAKDHPDWLQIGEAGKKNVFYGSQEDWVEATDESAWLCPISGYLEYFTKRIEKLAKSKLDGIWVDVPVFMDTGVKWNCQCDKHKAKFKQDTGHDLPVAKNCAADGQPLDACAKVWQDPIWREWLQHRHKDLNDFQMAVHAAARKVNPEFEVVFEVFTMDYNDAMDKGLDGTFMGNVEGSGHAWEIDSVSNREGMLRAKPDDWTNKIALNKFARGADKGRPTWVFCYGNIEWDAEMVMAITFAAQNNPYETKTPEMATTVGQDFRKRMYTWADKNLDAIYDSKSAARVGLLYSSYSRDYLDYPYGFALFSDVDPPTVTGVDPKDKKPYTGPDREWWSNERRDSVNNLEFLGEYRGYVKVLTHLHVPFNIEAMQKLKLADVQKYDTLLAPNLTAVDDTQAKLLKDFVHGGGTLIITGPRPTALDNLGNERGELALSEVLGFGKAAIPAAETMHSRSYGEGSVHWTSALLARRYLRYNDEVALNTLQTLLGTTTSSPLSTDADKMVYLDLYHLKPKAAAPAKTDDTTTPGPDELVLHLVNLVGVDGSGTPPKLPQQVKVTLELPPNTKAEKVVVTSPDKQTDSDVPHTSPEDGKVAFTAPVTYYAIARVKLTQAQTAGKLDVELAWPKKDAKAPRLAAAVRVTGKGLIGPVVRHLEWGTGTYSFADLPLGEKRVELITVDDHYGVVGRQARLAKFSGGSAKVSFTPGVAVNQGPTKLDAEVNDLIYIVNGTTGTASVQAGGQSQSLDAGKYFTVRLEKEGSIPFTAGSVSGTVQVKADAAVSFLTPKVDAISDSKGMAGHSVVFTGSGFGVISGKVLWGQEACTVTFWSPTRVVAYLPHKAQPGSAALVVDVHGRKSAGNNFTVEPPAFTPTKGMKLSFEFVRDKMRAPSGGVYTNLKDRNDPPDPSAVYPYGHHQTAEHMGLMTWMSAAMMDHEAFEQCYNFVLTKMTSPRRDVVNWAIDKVKGTPMLQREDKNSPWLNSNAPLDDFRVVKGLISGYMQWKDERYRNLALRIGNGLLETSVSKPDDFPKYPGGVVAYAYNWPELAGMGITDVVVIPIDYADLWTMRWLADYQPGWLKVIDENIKMMEASQIPSTGQYWNSYLQESKKFSGDFEYRDVIAGERIKAIQSLWIGIHLARVGRKASAQKSLDFYKAHYAKYQRVDEYLNADGSPCTESFFDKTLKMGEARIYSQVARLAYYLNDKAFGDKIIQEKIIPDQDLDPQSPTYGNIGLSTAGTGDAEAWNNLESLIALTFQLGSPVVNHVFDK